MPPSHGLGVTMPIVVCDIPSVDRWQENVTLALLILVMIEETTYHLSAMIPHSSWFNSKIVAHIAVVGSYACATSRLGHMTFILGVTRAATSPFEAKMKMSA
jgi:hypothetical protein